MKLRFFALLILAFSISIFSRESYADTVPPAFSYLPPTPANASYQNANYTAVNLSITEPNLDTFKFNWNNTNYSFYDDSLVLAMNFNNNSAIGENSTKAVDISKYGNNGTINGAVWNSSGRFGSALRFDGVNDYVLLPATGSYDVKGSLGLHYNENWSLSVWYKGNDTDVNGDWGKGLIGWNNPWLWSGLVLRNGYVEYIHYYSGWQHNIASTTLISDGIWHNIVYVNKVGGTGDLYVDAIKEIDNLPSAFNDGGLYFQPYHIGANYDGAYTNGTIDDVRIYNRSLSAAEIAMHYQSEFSKYNSTEYRFYDNITNLTDSAYSYYGWANDTAGNVNSTARMLTVDTVKPFVRIILPENTIYNSTARSLNYTVSDSNLGSCWYNLNAGANTTLSGCANTTFTAAEGANTITVYANDTSGNQNSSSVSFTIDTTPLAITILSPLNQTYSTASTWFNISVSETTSWCGYSLDGAENITMTGLSAQNTSMAELGHSVVFSCNDTTGWMASTSARYFTILTDATICANLNPTQCQYLKDGETTYQCLHEGNCAQWDFSDKFLNLVIKILKVLKVDMKVMA